MSHTPRNALRRQLLMLRHAQAEQGGSGRADFHRRLSEHGEREARAIGERLCRRHTTPPLIVTSPAVRARRTAELVADALRFPHTEMLIEPRLYLADAGTILAVVATVDESHDALLLVGHNPGLTAAARALAPALPVDSLPTAAVVAVVAPARSWAELTSTRCALSYYDSPHDAATSVRD